MSTLEQIVERDVIEYYDCVAVLCGGSHNYYFAQTPYDVTLSDSNTYRAAGGLLQIGDYTDNANFAVDQISVGLAGLVNLPTGDTVMKTIQELEYIDKPVIIRRAFFEDNAVAHDIILFKGYINNFTAVQGLEGDTVQVQIDVSSHWVDFDRVSTRYTNQNSQHDFHASDNGFEYAVDVQKEVVWREAV